MNSLALRIFYRDFGQNGGMPRELKLFAASLARRVDSLIVDSYGAKHAFSVTAEGYADVTYRWANHMRPMAPLRTAPQFERSLIRSRNEEHDNLLLFVVGSFIPENYAVTRVASRAGVPYALSIGAAFSPHLFSRSRDWRKRLYHRSFESRVVRDAAGIRLYSENQRDHLTQLGHRVGERGFVLKEGIDWEPIETNARHILEMPAGAMVGSGAPLFGYLGRLAIVGKGLDILLESWRRYVARGGLGQLVIRGPGSRAQLRDLSRLADGAERLTIGGPLSDTEKYLYLSRLHFLVVPSRHEGIPRVAREALAVGTPLICTPETNLHDIVEEYGAGLMTLPDSESLANSLLRAEAMSDRREELGARARSVAAQLDWNLIAERFVAWARCVRERSAAL